jgi:hypothetical protein
MRSSDEERLRDRAGRELGSRFLGEGNEEEPGHRIVKLPLRFRESDSASFHCSANVCIPGPIPRIPLG